MLKANVNKERVEVTITGNLPDICSDLSKLICTLNEKLSEDDHERGHMFRVMLTKGFMDGVCFDDDREHMNHYLAEGDKKYGKNVREEIAGKLDGLIDFLKEHRDQLDEIRKALEDKYEAE